MKAVFKTTGTKVAVRDHTASYVAGETIFRHAELGTEMFIIQEGEVDIVKNLGGEAHILSHLEKGDFFGEMAILENVPRTADAIARTDVKLVLINGSRFDEMLRKNPEIAVRIIRKYSQRLREANDLLEKLVGKGVENDQPMPPPPPAAVAAVEEPVPEPFDDVTPVNGISISRRRLVDVLSGTTFPFSNGDETTIGRSDPVTGILPDIDLTPVDSDRSVSRRHAKILRTGESYSVFEEVGTVNGTFVNDERIPTGNPVPIASGDRVKIGLIQMKVVYD
ncbi:MAG TPA: cyclic nucleotide-binding domain-containing protein [Thermoanaerobaculia bacterium]|nr:cyclic nucleotide-binding domain-containing protein [Thermoanaerobaculia bacterium]